jgi:hypothetical protein
MKDQQVRSGRPGAARNDYERTMKRAFGMPRGFFSPSWMMSGGVFEVDILSLQNEWETTDNDRSNL